MRLLPKQHEFRAERSLTAQDDRVLTTARSPSLEKWRTIWDHEFAGYGKRSITFASPAGAYHVHVDDEDQNSICVQNADREVRWGIEVKEVCGGTFRLSGMALGAGDFLGGGFWYELTLTSPSTISYWGDRVLEREDREV